MTVAIVIVVGVIVGLVATVLDRQSAGPRWLHQREKGACNTLEKRRRV